MKRFQFSLERALGWRRTQAEVEEATLEKLRAKLKALQASMARIAEERDAAADDLLKKGSATGGELASLDLFRQAADRETARVGMECESARKRIAEQTRAVQKRQREVKLLERLRDRQLENWQEEFERELERDAAESHLARFVRER